MGQRNISSGIKLSEIPNLLGQYSRVRREVAASVQLYVVALMLTGYQKSLTDMAKVTGSSIDSFSRMLANPSVGEKLQAALNRHIRRVISAKKRTGKKVSVHIIIDSTVIPRVGRNVENTSFYHSASGKVRGHRLTNIGLLLDSEFFIPLASLPQYTKKYARSLGLCYQTETEMLQEWMRLNMNDLLHQMAQMAVPAQDITFLLDAGYDTQSVQQEILQYNCHFNMMIKCSRSVGGRQVDKYFRQNRHLAWSSIRLNKKISGKTKRREFRIRVSTEVQLKGVGPVVAVCSEKVVKGRRNPRRYLVSSRISSSGRNILLNYSLRWSVETWHKIMKQDYGWNDGSVHHFRSMENHLKLCHLAYLCHLINYRSMPCQKTSVTSFVAYSTVKSARLLVTQAGGMEVLDDEIRSMKKGIFYHGA